MSGKTLDEALQAWDENYGAKEGGTGKKARRSVPGSKGSAARARSSLQGIANKAPQAVVKITGGGKGTKAISAHLRYISRNGDLALEDQAGEQYEGREARHDIIERWENGRWPTPAEGEHREAFNIVLSPGKGSDGAALQRAAREFASEQFGGNYDYVMALHTPETDPSFGKSEHPHVHLVVKARGHDGKRLNPRKADLFAYRQAFARALRANGVASIAVRREALFHTKAKGEKQSTFQMKKRGATPEIAKTAETQPAAMKKALASEAKALELYTDVVVALAKSEWKEDRSLAESLRKVLPAIAAPAPAQAPAKGWGR